MDSGVFQWLKVDGEDSPLTVPCDDGDWPKDYVVTHSTNCGQRRGQISLAPSETHEGGILSEDKR